MARKTALITGASSGIGETFARKLASRGFDLILVARREDRLQKIAGDLAGATALVADLSTLEGIAKVESAISKAESLEMLVNNAGFGTMGRFWVADLEGKKKEWDAEIYEQVPQRRIAWRSTTGMRNASTVDLLRKDPQHTRVTLKVDYESEISSEYSDEALELITQRVEGDLERFKDYIQGHPDGPVE